MFKKVGFVVIASVVTGLVLGLVLSLGAFGGGTEAETMGSALGALGTGFLLLALASRRSTQPQGWALGPGVGASAAGLALFVTAPGDRGMHALGWVWPVLLAALVARSFLGARGSLQSWTRRAVLYPALAVLLVVALAGAFETVASATTANAAPGGRTYLVNGHRLYLDCAGSGAPTVVLFNGLGERTPSWAWVERELAPTTRVCVFDRAGEGWSGAGVGRQDGLELAADAHALLRTAGVRGPYVLAGHSVGGTYALVYAKRYPAEVAGVALIDSSSPYQFDLPGYPRFYSLFRRGTSLLPSVARSGLGRLTLGSGTDVLPARAARSARLFARSPRELRADHDDVLELPTVFRQAQALRSLGGKPLAVVSAGVGQQRGWPGAQASLARLSRNSVHITVPGATHEGLLLEERYATTAARAIEGVVRFARWGRR